MGLFLLMPICKKQTKAFNKSLILLICLAISACGSSGSSNGSSVSSSSSSDSSTNTSNPSSNNTSPTITGTPTSNVSENSAYSFTPFANDTDGDKLTFSITNKPSWASFNTVTGQLTGTPITTGHYPEIVISVSDGIATSSLPSFTIDVLGSAVLNWSKPTLNTDGTDLTDLTGYVVYYGTSPNTSELTKNIPISDGNTTSTTIEGLSTGTTYYFAVASISASRGEGKKSNPASKTIN